MTEVVIGNIDEIPIGEGRAYGVDGVQVAVYRMRDGSLRALGAVCPHRGGPLADGLIDDRVVICPLHGHTYDLTTGTERSSGGQAVACYRVSADADGTIRLDVGAADAAAPSAADTSR